MFIDKEVFDRDLLLTQAYCDLQIIERSERPPVEILRSYNSRYHDGWLFKYVTCVYKNEAWDSGKWKIDPLMDGKDLYERFFQEQIEHKQKIIGSLDAAGNYKGRILRADIDESVVDGASEMVSNGVIDINDCPPIDTWFYLTTENNLRVLFAWIPEPFIQLVNEAIEVNCVDCLSWYNEGSY